jgi:hypothetical protein
MLLLAEEKNEVEFECKTKEEDDGTEIKDKIKFGIKVDKGQGLKVKVKYEQEIETTDTETGEETETETKTQYEVNFDRVIEYRKADSAVARSSTGGSDADMAYEWDRDTIVQEMPLNNWTNLSPIDEQGSLSTFSIATQDNTATFTFHITSDDSATANRLLAVNSTGTTTANKMEIDFELTNFPWTSDDTYVALLSTVESERKIKLEENDDGDDSGVEADSSPVVLRTTSRKPTDVKITFADAVDTIKFTPFGEFDWVDTAEVRADVTDNSTDTNTRRTESTTIQVVATSPADETSDAIAFSFVGTAAHMATDIYWDPSAGVAYETGSGALASSFMGVVSLGFVVLASMM